MNNDEPVDQLPTGHCGASAFGNPHLPPRAGTQRRTVDKSVESCATLRDVTYHRAFSIDVEKLLRRRLNLRSFADRVAAVVSFSPS